MDAVREAFVGGRRRAPHPLADRGARAAAGEGGRRPGRIRDRGRAQEWEGEGRGRVVLRIDLRGEVVDMFCRVKIKQRGGQDYIT